MAEPRIRVYEVSSPEYGTCWLTSLTAALHHVKACVKQDGSDKVALRVRSVSRRRCAALPGTCGYGRK